MTAHTKAKLAFVVWLVTFPVVACGPALSSNDLIGFLLGGFAGVLLGSLLFLPWIVGVGVLYLVMRLTEDPRPPYPPTR